MAKQQMSFSIALMISLVGALLAYWIFKTHSLPGSDPLTFWRSLSLGWRVGVLGCFIAFSYGLGGMLSALQRRKGP
jgi:hypothetical protein